MRVNYNGHFETIYDLVGFLDAVFGREPISCPADNNNSDLGSATPPKAWGYLCSGNHLMMCHQVLDTWQYDCWKENYQLCSWGAMGVTPDLVLSKLATSTKIKTIDNLLEAVSDWVTQASMGTKYSHY